MQQNELREKKRIILLNLRLHFHTYHGVDACELCKKREDDALTQLQQLELQPLDEKKVFTMLIDNTPLRPLLLEKLAHAICKQFGVPKAQLFNKEKYESIVTDLLEKTFPKGECKERGKALLFIARLWIELEKFSIPKISKERLKEIMSENMFADETPHNPTCYITYNLEDLATAILEELEKGGSA